MVRDVAAARALVDADRRGGGAAGRPRPPDRARAAARRRARGGRRSRRARADLGVMLPYSPLHHLLLADVGEPLVMTSGNVSDEPIAYEDDDALERLAGIADLVLFHDRPIHTRTDDSVLRAVPGRRPLLMRRSRGFVPDALALPVPPRRHAARVRRRAQEHVLRRQGRARVGRPPHRRPQERTRCCRPSRRAIEHFERLFAVVPGGRRPRPAPRLPLDPLRARPRGRRGRRASSTTTPTSPPCLAEHGETGPAVGAIYDGTGYGTRRHGLGRRAAGRRPARLRARRAPVAGAPARRRPRRARSRGGWPARGCSRRAGDGPLPGAGPAARASRSPSSCAAGSPSPVTTSMGRLFDAVAALCGLRAEVTYEGQAAVELEAAADPARARRLRAPGDARTACSTRARPCSRWRATSPPASRPGVGLRALPRRGRARHRGGVRRRRPRGLGTVVLSGGVFQNRRLLAATAGALEARGPARARARAPAAQRRRRSPTARRRVAAAARMSRSIGGSA